MLDLNPIKARLAAAAPGPWECSRERPDHTGDHVVCEATFDVRRVASAGRWVNALLIANAPGDLAALVAEVERLRELLDQAGENLPSVPLPGDPLGTIKVHLPANTKKGGAGFQVNTGGGGRPEPSPANEGRSL